MSVSVETFPSSRYHSLFREQAFNGQVVLVTGGGSGIGRCTAHELAALGAQVVISGRTESKLQQVCEEITADGGKATYRSCDIREEDQVKALIAGIISDFGRLDGLVNNAGGQFPAPLSMISANGFQAVIRNNLNGTFLMMREAYTQWMEQHGGSIVNMTADMWGEIGRAHV